MVTCVVDLSIALPTIDAAELPARTPIVAGRPAVLQCRVHSQAVPTIKWFRQLSDGDDNDNDGGDSTEADGDRNGTTTAAFVDSADGRHGSRVRLLGGVYERLESAGERALGDGVYLSKVQLPADAAASGTTFVCVAVNYRGYVRRETQISVGGATSSQSQSLVHDDDGESAATTAQETQLMLLFLIPLALAAMPLLMWACYLMCRSREAAAAARQRHDKQLQQTAAAVGRRRYSLVCQNEIYV